MEKQIANCETLARDYAARLAGVTTRYVNQAIRGERKGPLAETSVANYRKKLKELIQATSIPQSTKTSN